ncbi:unnamed protein product [Blepharisma stoltei]|uniref:Uncharacterized protein n=1 Tax=Blepharisma stoltei TaxID=1481888 RepID=A0AAU9IGF0_9CILI|nr:unnamed protein product [Blepharisma stoltei]
MYASKALIILVRSNLALPQSYIINSLISRGCCGHLVWKTSDTLLRSLCSSSPADFDLFSNISVEVPHTQLSITNIEADVANSKKKLVIVVLDASGHESETLQIIENLITSYIELFRVSFILEPCEFPQERENNSIISDILPKQSYNFKDCVDISESINRNVSAFYADYEKNYTRIDWSQSLEEAMKEKGGNQIILADNYLKEIGFRLGLCPKYGS